MLTYVHAGVLDGTADFPEAARWLHNVARAGEPWTFGLRPEEVRRASSRRAATGSSATPRPGNWVTGGSRRAVGANAGSELYRVAGRGGRLMPKVSDTYRADRRHAILEAAVACFDRRGLHTTTTDDIAAEAGLSAGALYRYFDGKEAIVEAIAAERHARELELLLAASDGRGSRAGIAGFVDDYFAWISTPDERRRRRVNVHVWAEALANPRVAAIVREGIAPTADAARLVEGAVASGALPAHVEPQGFVHVVLALLQGFMLQAAWDPELDVEAFRATVLAMIEAHLAPVDAALIRERRVSATATARPRWCGPSGSPVCPTATARSGRRAPGRAGPCTTRAAPGCARRGRRATASRRDATARPR